MDHRVDISLKHSIDIGNFLIWGRLVYIISLHRIVIILFLWKKKKKKKGANGLANPRDFLYPVASYEDIDTGDRFKIISKFQGNFFYLEQKHSPFDVVAWHGNYAPFKYDLRRFNTINTVSFDHPVKIIFIIIY